MVAHLREYVRAAIQCMTFTNPFKLGDLVVSGTTEVRRNFRTVQYQIWSEINCKSFLPLNIQPILS